MLLETSLPFRRALKCIGFLGTSLSEACQRPGIQASSTGAIFSIVFFVPEDMQETAPSPCWQRKNYLCDGLWGLMFAGVFFSYHWPETRRQAGKAGADLYSVSLCPNKGRNPSPVLVGRVKPAFIMGPG